MKTIIDTILSDKEFGKLYAEHRSRVGISTAKDTYNVVIKIKESLLESLNSEKNEELAEKYSQYIDALFAHTIINSTYYIQKEDTDEHHEKPFTSKREKVNFLLEVIGLPYIKYFVTERTMVRSYDHIDILCSYILRCKTVEEKEAYLKNFHEKLAYLSSFFESGNDSFHKLLRANHVTKAHLEILGPDIAGLDMRTIEAIFFGWYDKKDDRSMCGYPEASLPHMEALGKELLCTVDPKTILSIYNRLSPDMIECLKPTKFEGIHFLEIGRLAFIPKEILPSLLKDRKDQGKTLIEGINEYIQATYGEVTTDREVGHIARNYNFKTMIRIDDKDYLGLLHAVCKINSCSFTDITKSIEMQRMLQLLGYNTFKNIITGKDGEQALYRRRGIFDYAAVKAVDGLTQAQIEELGGIETMRSNELAEKVFRTYPDKINIDNEVVKYGKKIGDDKLKSFSLGQLYTLKSSNLAKLSEHQLNVVRRMSPEEIQRIGKNISKYTPEEINNQIFFDLGEEVVVEEQVVEVA